MTKVTFEKDELSFALDSAKMPEASRVYLIQYGYKQSMADCIAGREKAVRAERTKAGDNEAAILKAIAADLKAQLEKRQKALEEGNPPSISARIDPVTALAREVVTKNLRKKGKRVTRERYDELVTECVKKNGAALKAELVAREKRFDVEISVD